jgi:hypothetical protein
MARYARTLRLGQAVLVKGLQRGEHGGGLQDTLAGFACGHVVASPGQGLQQLACVLKVAPPQHGGAGASQAVGGVCGQGVVCQFDPRRRCGAALRSPQRRAGQAALGPVDVRQRLNSARSVCRGGAARWFAFGISFDSGCYGTPSKGLTLLNREHSTQRRVQVFGR